MKIAAEISSRRKVRRVFHYTSCLSRNVYCMPTSGHVLCKILNNSNEICTKRDKILFMALVKQACIFFFSPYRFSLNSNLQDFFFFCKKLRDRI